MHRIALHPPRVLDHEAVFRWEVEPATPLYRATSFSLRFPEGVDLARVPPAVWWAAALLCLHPHWALLRPCVVRIPARLPPGTAGTWSRLVAAAATTMEAYAGRRSDGSGVEILEEGPPVAPSPRAEDRGRCAAAFSGGKDSLLQAGLLCETSERPLLVTTTAPMPPHGDHGHPRRRRAIEEVARRRDVEVVEVRSDLRSTWDNRFPRRLGVPLSVNEVTDTLLYTASLAVVGAARGATHLFLASENEVSETAEVGGLVVQHPHFMYSVPTQRAVDGVLRAAAGLSYGSLTSALHSNQVQELLWTRYADLRDLQFSCWKARPEEGACSGCSQCLRLALGALALDDDPALLGVDLARVLVRTRRWDPFRAPADPAEAALPEHLTARRLRAHAVRCAERVPEERVAARLPGGRGPAAAWRAWRARRAFATLRRRVAGHGFGPAPGYREGWLRLADQLLADRLRSVFASRFAPEPPASYAAGLARCERLSAWLLEPLSAAAAGA